MSRSIRSSLSAEPQKRLASPITAFLARLKDGRNRNIEGNDGEISRQGFWIFWLHRDFESGHLMRSGQQNVLYGFDFVFCDAKRFGEVGGFVGERFAFIGIIYGVIEASDDINHGLVAIESSGCGKI